MIRATRQAMDADSFDLFIEQLRRYVRERLLPMERQVAEDDLIPGEIVDEMRELGLFGLSVPEEYGGAGMSISQYIRSIHVLGYAMPAFRSIITMNTGMFCAALKNGGTAQQKTEWLPRVAAGEIASFALTEPESGSDAAGLQTTARQTPDGWVLNGTKRYITNATCARVALVMARTERDNLPRNAHVSAFIVPLDRPGVSIGKPDRKMGQAGSQIADIVLNDVKLPRDALLGGATGRGFALAMMSLDTGRISVGAAATAYARRALDSALAYARQRKAFGEPIANFQLIQQMLADSDIEIYAAESMLADVSRRADEGENILRQAAAFKVFATEMCGRVVDRVVQIHGGAGYLSEYDAERFYRDARLYRIYEGTTQILQLQVAKHLLREAASQFPG